MANLTFSTGASQATVKLKKVGKPFTNSFTTNSSAYTIGDTITIPANSSVTFVGSNNYLSKDGSDYYQFETTGGELTLSGDLISLVNNSSVKMYSFFNLFKGCTNITDISDLVFPSGIADWCYSNMFMDCTGLVDAGTTLPATRTTMWCYSGMFARCTSLTTPPTILATKLNPFCYYGMFTGCSSLVEGPTLLNRVVEGEFSNNIMFKDCSSLSTLTVSFTSWPTGNWSRKWLDGVAQTGLFVKPNTLPDQSIPEGYVPAGWQLSSTYPSIINVASETFSFDAMSDTDQLKELAYTYNNPEGTVTITPNLTNAPGWLIYSTDSDSINFSANGYAITADTSFDIPIQLSAADAETKNVVATFNISNYPTYTIGLTTIPTFTFDKESETNIVCSLFDYETGYLGNSLSCEVEGELPTGLSCVDGVITGTPSQFTANFGPTNFNVIYSAQDARTVTSSVPIQIVNAVPDYSSMPMTYECIEGTASVKFPLCMQHTVYNSNWNSSNSPVSSLYYRLIDSNGTGNWVDWKSQGYTEIALTAGQKMELSGTNGYQFSRSWGSYFNKFLHGGTGKLILYGNLSSLFDPSITTVNIANVWWQDSSYANNVLVDASKFIIPFNTNVGQGFNSFGQNYGLIKGPLFTGTGFTNSMFNYAFQVCTSLSCLEVSFITNNNWSFNFCFNSVNTYGLFIKPQNTYTPGHNTVPTNWLILNRKQDGTLQVAETRTWNGKSYTSGQVWGLNEGEEDPYAWYYNK